WTADGEGPGHDHHVGRELLVHGDVKSTQREILASRSELLADFIRQMFERFGDEGPSPKVLIPGRRGRDEGCARGPWRTAPSGVLSTLRTRQRNSSNRPWPYGRCACSPPGFGGGILEKDLQAGEVVAP